jgi:hypothetical protein
MRISTSRAKVLAFKGKPLVAIKIAVNEKKIL